MSNLIVPTGENASVTAARAFGLFARFYLCLRSAWKPEFSLPMFKVDVAMARFGPDQALSQARAASAAPRNATEALQLARIMLTAGKTHLASQHLHRWPGETDFRDLLFMAYLIGGWLDDTKALLNQLMVADLDGDVTHLRIRPLFESGDLGRHTISFNPERPDKQEA